MKSVSTRDELWAATAERLEKFITSAPPAQAKLFGIRITSGTTGGGPLVSVNSYNDSVLELIGDAKRILICLGSRNIRLARLLHGSRAKQKITALALDARDLAPGLEDMLAQFAPDHITAFPSFLIRVSEYLDPPSRATVRRINFTGERLSAQMSEFFHAQFPNARIDPDYSATELGQIGRACEFLPLNSYHPARGVTISIKDADDSGAGEMLITKVTPSGVSIENYQVGDMGRMYTVLCRCGAPVSFEHLGRRGYDYIKLAGAILRREEFDRVTSMFPHYIDDYRAEAGERIVDGKLKGAVVLRVFKKNGALSSALCEQIARDFSRALFVTPTQTYADLVAKGFFLPLAVEFSPTPFPEKNKDIKLTQST